MEFFAEHVESVYGHRFRMDFTGLMYLPGHHAGQRSAEAFLDLLRRDRLPSKAHLLRGRFAAHIVDSTSDRSWTFVDNSGMFPLYYDDLNASDSFRRLLTQRATPMSVNLVNAAEFLLMGFNSANRTLVDGVRRLLGDQILVGGDELTVIPKALPPLENETAVEDRTLYGLMEEFASSIQGFSVSVDITGGLDSRLLATYLTSLLPTFETALGANSLHEDVRIGREVARALGKPFYLTEPPEVNHANALDLYQASDGTTGNLESVFRKGQLQRDRVSRGIVLSLDGTGGELYKDFWWLQDFPRYRHKSARVRRLYDLRIEPVKFPLELLSDAGKELLQVARTRALAEMESVEGEFNTYIYDKLYLDRMRGLPSLLNAATKRATTLESYSPLLELEHVRVGFHLPRAIRAFDRFHRREITRCSSAASRIPTSKGTPASAGIESSLQLMSSYARNYTMRAVNKAWQRWRNQRIREYSEPGNTNELVAHIRRSEEMGESLTELARMGILNPNRSAQSASAVHEMRLLVLGMVVIESNKLS